MRNFIFFLLCSNGLIAQQNTVSPDTVVLTVHERQYTRAEFEAMAKQQNLGTNELASRLQAGNALGRSRAIADEARRRKLDQNDAIRTRIENYTNAVLGQALFEEIADEVHKDPSLAKVRLESGQHFAEERKLRVLLVRHIKSVPTPGRLTVEQAQARAEALRKKIVAGASFAEVAKAESEDERTKSKGGDMNFVRKPVINPDLGEVAFKMKVGEVSAPVKTTEGYFLVTVEKVVPPDLELVRKSLEFEIARERMQKMSFSGVILNPAYFGDQK